ncbi:hypothetical protein QL285_074121 [Trifolium repens]|nr:hypothetical protein QL285_074121 [Trifolium repens]
MEGTNVLTSSDTQTSTEVQLTNVNGNNLALNSQELQEKVADMAAKMVMICSSLQDVIEIVQNQSKRIGDHADNVQKLISTIHGTINKVQMENIEKVLNKPKASTTANTQLSPNTNSPPVVYSNSPHSGNEDISNIILFISSDEEDLKDKPRKTHKLNKNATPHKKTLSANRIPTVKSSTPRSTYLRVDKQRVSSSKLRQKLTVDEVDCMVGRKLSFVPSPNIKQLSVPKIQPMHDFVQPKSFSKLGTEVSTGLILSKFMKPKTEEITDLCPPKTFTAKLNQPTSLCSNFNGVKNTGQILSKIVHMMAMKINWNQKRVSSPTKWALPPAFVRAVKMGLSIEDLVSEFADYWMPHKQLFHIAPYFEKQDVYPRQQTIEKMWQAIAQMSKSSDFPSNFLAENFNNDMWTVSDPIGHLGIGFCQHTAVYVLDWMDSENRLCNNDSFGVSSNLFITSDTYFYKFVNIDNNLTENITSLQHTE